MSKNNIPYIFLLLLILLLIFIGGVKYGQKVEEANKTIKYILSITPTKVPPTLTVAEPLQFKTYNDDTCGIKFLYPDYLKPRENISGMFTGIDLVDSSDNGHLYIDCVWPDKPYDGPQIETPQPIKQSFEKVLQTLKIPETATESMVFKNQKIAVYKDPQSKNKLVFKFWHPKLKDTYAVVFIDKNLYPLFENTLEFTTPTPTKKPSVTSIISP